MSEIDPGAKSDAKLVSMKSAISMRLMLGKQSKNLPIMCMKTEISLRVIAPKKKWYLKYAIRCKIKCINPANTMHQQRYVTGKLHAMDMHIPIITIIFMITGVIAGIKKWPTACSAPPKRALLDINKINGIKIWSMGTAATSCCSENPGAITWSIWCA